MTRKVKPPRGTSKVDIPVHELRRALRADERERANLLGVAGVRASGWIQYRRWRPGMEQLEPARWIIRLDVAPFVNAESVARAYAKARRWLWFIGRDPDQGDLRPSRALGARAMKLLRFVNEQKRKARSARRPTPSVRALQDRWNRYHPKDRIEDVRHFARACRNARDLLAGGFPVPRNLR